jgi:hypothetical protein
VALGLPPGPRFKEILGAIEDAQLEGQLHTREEALAWAARIAESCRCPQEVREIMFDPES